MDAHSRHCTALNAAHLLAVRRCNQTMTAACSPPRADRQTPPPLGWGVLAELQPVPSLGGCSSGAAGASHSGTTRAGRWRNHACEARHIKCVPAALLWGNIRQTIECATRMGGLTAGSTPQQQ